VNRQSGKLNPQDTKFPRGKLCTVLNKYRKNNCIFFGGKGALRCMEEYAPLAAQRDELRGRHNGSF